MHLEGDEGSHLPPVSSLVPSTRRKSADRQTIHSLLRTFHSFSTDLRSSAKFTMGGSSSTRRENKNISSHRRNTSPPQPPQVPLKISNYVTVHKNTIKLEVDKCKPGEYLVSFTFDALYDGSFAIFYFGKEEADCTITPLYTYHQPVQVRFSKGADQKFCQPSGTGFDLSSFDLDSDYDDLVEPSTRDSVFPLVIMAESCEKPLPQPLPPTAGEASNVQQPPPPPTTEEASNELLQRRLPPPTIGEASNKQFQSRKPATATIEIVPDEQLEQKLLPPRTTTQITQAVINIPEECLSEEKKKKIDEGQFLVEVMKQNLWVDGVRYELVEMYGIGTSAEGGSVDPGKECCVICLSEPKDTAVFPCRHMCLCSECARELRLQTSKCPICRQPIENFIQIKFNKSDE